MIERSKARGSIRSPRRGNVAVEMLLVMPILLALILGTIEMSMMTAANEQLCAASREGARVAALGGDTDEVNRAVYNHLNGGSLSQADVWASLTDRDGKPIPSGEPVMVRVQIPANHAVPDLLAIIGVSIGNSTLIGQTIMRKE